MDKNNILKTQFVYNKKKGLLIYDDNGDKMS